ncbi:MAG TPA: class I mannose-6-phosphate isomerase [Rubrobacter sp.]|nr:class I mannose-6-phosphate isomerase [Rubrobacter sp.]
MLYNDNVITVVGGGPAWRGGAIERYPIKPTAHVRAYAFGERLIPERLGKTDVPEGRVAETWEVSDYGETTSDVKNGPYTGRTLHELVEKFPDALVGEGWRGPHFPLLEKFIDASHMLPVHLHADDETARTKHGEPNGKTEAWHILWAAEGATILAGVREGVGEDDLRDAFLAEDHDAVMLRHPIRAGDTVYVPGGVIHAFGPDALVFEVQQTSDLGQFVTPTNLYGERLDEETWRSNIEAALDELRTEYRPHPNQGLVLESGKNRRTLCCAGPHFALERWALAGPLTEPAHPDRCLTLSNVGGPVRIEYAGGTEALGRGESCVLPAVIGEVSVSPGEAGENGGASLIACYVPDLERDVVAPLRRAGYSDEEIRGLGEVCL